MALLSDPALDVRQYLENLVTIAVGSAREAEDTLFEVRKANKKARRARGQSPTGGRCPSGCAR
jgi:hypothetical protein